MPNAELLTPIEVDFLWESAALGELPYPLRIRSHGATVDERDALRARTLGDLVQRGLADGRGRPAPHLEEYFGILAAPDASLDTVQLLDPNAEPLLAVAGIVDRSGLFAVQDQRGLHLQPCPADGLATAIVSLLPGAPRGTEKSITVPLEQLVGGAGVDFMQRRGNQVDASGRASVDEDRKALARLHAQPRLRGGQIGANARNRLGGRSRSPVLSWFDTETGRYFTQATRGHDGRDWITIAPADAATLRHRLGEMMADAAGHESAAAF
ncbi:ESX secretion-associated protein EspG [Amycolatopsis rhabdoformis]|uniref:ESX secretion-associated protein EspG n=1 Tax=Amycolatopsis rhabdoformis TaxID=1448059 RepID=A0ABZ1I044_9PSEU|nr:ESX secretion-associated protein EspG [Amycolatopsis rhabdoformis]WSE27749.1 ESX secretion-associated protein EspG [Amycolatopsis rhabdoformis]